MRMSSRCDFVLAGATAIGVLSGCSGGGAPTLAPGSSANSAQTQSIRSVTTDAFVRGTNIPTRPFGMRQSMVHPSIRAPFVNVAGVNANHGNQTFVADAATATITVWGGAGQLNAILFDGIAADPNGLTTDGAESLYVANVLLENVVVYPKPYTTIARTLLDPGEETEDVAVSQTGVVGVTNYLTAALQPGSVSIYAKGATTACATLQDPKWITFLSDAFDASGNLFFNGQNSLGTVLVGEISGGCKATSITTLALGNTISSLGGMAVSRGSIVIEDPLKQTLYTYAAPSNGSLGSPTATTALAGATNPVGLAMMEGGRNVWTADFNATLGLAGKYGYPGGAALKSLDDNILPIGIAVIPAAKP